MYQSSKSPLKYRAFFPTFARNSMLAGLSASYLSKPVILLHGRRCEP